MSERNSFIESVKEKDERFETLKKLYPELFSDDEVNTDVLKDILVPAIIVCVYSLILFVFNKKEKKSLICIISTVIATQMPVVLAALVSILTIVSRDFSKISIAFNGFCMSIAMVLSFFGFKSILNEEENDKFIKKFVLIQVIYYVIAFILTFLKIYVY